MRRRRHRFDLIALGDTTTDVFLAIHDASIVCHIKKKDCLLCIEYADKIPVEHMTEVLGVGNAANNAVGSARLGLTTALWTILGNDAVGKRTRREVFLPERVDLRYVEFDQTRRTNFSAVINFRGERTILVFHEERTYRLPHLAPASWIYLTSMGKGWETILPALRAYQQRTGARIGCNPGTHQLRAQPRILKPVYEMAEVLLVNRDEARRILGVERGSPKTLLAGLRALGPRIVVVTDGPKGAYAEAAGERWFMPTFRGPVVERTGAGDSFSTGFLAALSYNKSLGDALRWGTANATSVIQYIGAREGLLTRPALERLIAAHRGIRPRKL